MQYLYAEGDHHIFMDLTTYEQLGLAEEDISEQLGYLLPNMEVQINFHNESPIGMELPLNVILEVIDTESVVKGQTATSSGKPAKLETGITVTVPQFICAGEKVKVNTGTGEYVERASS
jgi:elongation factor P